MPRHFPPIIQDGGFTSYILTLCLISNMQLYRPPLPPSHPPTLILPISMPQHPLPLKTSQSYLHFYILQNYIIAISYARNACGRDGCGGNGAGRARPLRLEIRVTYSIFRLRNMNFLKYFLFFYFFSQ